MKHVFLVHSSITFISFLGVLERNKLKEEDVILLLDRNYILDDKYNFIHYDVSHLSDAFKGLKLLSVFNMRSRIKLVDSFIMNSICDSYVMYLPQVQSMFNQTLITNFKCVSYGFIEEGLANYKASLYYKPSVKLSLATTVLKFFFNIFSYRLSVYPSFLGAYKKLNLVPKYYLFNKDCAVKGIDVVPINFLKEDNVLLYEDQSYFFISSALVEMNILDFDSFTKLLNSIRDFFIESEASSVCVKFHPAQSQQIKDSILNIFGSLNLEILPDNYSIEQLSLHRDDLNIIGIESSVLYYCKFLNNKCNVYSFLNYFYDLKPKRMNSDDKESIVEMFKVNNISLL